MNKLAKAEYAPTRTAAYALIASGLVMTYWDAGRRALHRTCVLGFASGGLLLGVTRLGLESLRDFRSQVYIERWQDVTGRSASRARQASQWLSEAVTYHHTLRTSR